MLVAALRRLALLVLFAVAATAVVSLLAGLLLHASLDRAISLGFYGVGCFLMVGGFFVGNRGPARVKSENLSSPIMTPFAMMSSRQLRWATPSEQNETINQSAVFIGVGFILVIVGVLVDGRHSLW